MFRSMNDVNVNEVQVPLVFYYKNQNDHCSLPFSSFFSVVVVQNKREFHLAVWSSTLFRLLNLRLSSILHWDSFTSFSRRCYVVNEFILMNRCGMNMLIIDDERPKPWILIFINESLSTLFRWSQRQKWKFDEFHSEVVKRCFCLRFDLKSASSIGHIDSCKCVIIIVIFLFLFSEDDNEYWADSLSFCM